MIVGDKYDLDGIEYVVTDVTKTIQEDGTVITIITSEVLPVSE